MYVFTKLSKEPQNVRRDPFCKSVLGGTKTASKTLRPRHYWVSRLLVSVPGRPVALHRLTSYSHFKSPLINVRILLNMVSIWTSGKIPVVSPGLQDRYTVFPQTKLVGVRNPGNSRVTPTTRCLGVRRRRTHQAHTSGPCDSQISKNRFFWEPVSVRGLQQPHLRALRFYVGPVITFRLFSPRAIAWRRRLSLPTTTVSSSDPGPVVRSFLDGRQGAGESGGQPGRNPTLGTQVAHSSPKWCPHCQQEDYWDYRTSKLEVTQSLKYWT